MFKLALLLIGDIICALGHRWDCLGTSCLCPCGRRWKGKCCVSRDWRVELATNIKKGV